MKWEKIIDKGTSPPLIHEAAFKELEGVLYVIGGKGLDGYSFDNYSFDTKST